MAKNKKPRKQYHKRWRTQKLICDQKEVDAIKETFSDVELAVEMKLPRGMMSMQDVQELRDMLNLSTVLMFHGYGIEPSYCQETYGAAWRRMQDAFHSYYVRVVDKGIFTATGDELNAIRDGITIAGVIMQKTLDADPFRVAVCYGVVKEKADGGPGRIQVSMELIERRIRELQRAEHGTKGVFLNARH